MPDILLSIPEEVAEGLRMAPADRDVELRKELALTLYQRELLPISQAARLAQMRRWDFEQLLCERRIERPFSEEELLKDLDTARELGEGARPH